MKCDEEHDPLIQKDSANGPGEVELTDPTEGKAEIKFSPSDTTTMTVGEYLFDVWVVLASGARSPVILPSPFFVKTGVTVLT